MERCTRCGRTEQEVRLFDGIYVNDMTKICEKCSLIAGIPIIKRPSANQLKSSEKPYGVRERLMRMNHLSGEDKSEKSPYEELRELENKPELERPEDLVFKLVDNFHWIIQTERRRKGLTTKQLADSLHESESAIKLLEKKIVPSKAMDLIRSLEQFFKISLIRRDILDKIEEQKKQDDKVNAFVLQKKTEIIKKQESPIIGSIKTQSYTPGSYRSRLESKESKINELQRQTDKIEKDFSFDVKSRQQVGEEQTDRFGKEDVDYLKKKISKEKPKSSAPSIYELMKRKEERDKELVGKDIEVLDEKPKDLDM